MARASHDEAEVKESKSKAAFTLEGLRERILSGQTVTEAVQRWAEFGSLADERARHEEAQRAYKKQGGK